MSAQVIRKCPRCALPGTHEECRRKTDAELSDVLDEILDECRGRSDIDHNGKPNKHERWRSAITEWLDRRP